MAEIKSTLDIIMEKAKKYSVTDEDKKVFKRRELEGRIKGLIQKYVDALLDLDRFKMEMAALEPGAQEEIAQVMRTEALKRVKPGVHNESLLEILSVAGMDTGPVQMLLRDFEERIHGEKAICEKTALEKLREKGISGSAVLPNLDGDEGWLKAVSEAERDFREKLKSLGPKNASSG